MSPSPDLRAAAYARLPYPAKVLAASARGVRLRAWRYGPGFEGEVRRVLDRDRWAAERWRSWQQARLAAVLAHAAATVPHHHRWFARHPDRDPSRLADWPVLTKPDLLADPAALVADDAPRRRYRDQTSGTSGTPLAVWTSRADLQAFFALHEARTRRWHGVSRHDRWAILGGQLVTAPGRDHPPYWVENRALRQLYLSVPHVSAATIADYVAVLERFRPSHLVVYPSAAAFLARTGLDAGHTGAGPRVVVANAEPVTPPQRELIEAFFACPLRETYGMAEMAAGASECEAGTLHLWPDCGVVEVVDDDDRPVPEGEVGRLVLTGLVNDTTAFVRYANGDRGRRPRWGERCACGRGLPVLPTVEGRVQDLLVTPGGGRQFWVNPAFYGLPVREAQVVQDRVDRVRARVVPAPGFSAGDEATIVTRLEDRLPGVAVSVEQVEAIERGPNGKFPPVVSRVLDPTSD